MPSNEANHFFRGLFRFLCGFLCAFHGLLRPFAALCCGVLLLDGLLLPVTGHGVRAALRIITDILFVQDIHIGLIQLLFFLVKFPLRLELVGVVSGFACMQHSLRCSFRSMGCLNTSILILGFPDVPMYLLRQQPAGRFLYFMRQFRGWLGCIALKLQPCFLLYLLYTVSRFLRFLNGLF